MIDFNILKENPELAKSVKLEMSFADMLALFESIHKKAIAESLKNAHKDEEYLTPAEYAKILKISLVSLWSWDKKGITKPLYIGNKKLYRRSDLEKILNH